MQDVTIPTGAPGLGAVLLLQHLHLGVLGPHTCAVQMLTAAVPAALEPEGGAAGCPAAAQHVAVGAVASGPSVA